MTIWLYTAMQVVLTLYLNLNLGDIKMREFDEGPFLIIMLLVVVAFFLAGSIVFNLLSKSTSNSDYGWLGDIEEVEDMFFGMMIWDIPEYSNDPNAYKVGWDAHKIWKSQDSLEELQKILNLLVEETKSSSYKWNLKDCYRLRLYFYGDSPDNVKVLFVYFDEKQLRKGRFVGPIGYSEELGKFFQKYLPPKRPEPEPNIPFIDRERVEEMKRQLQEYAEKDVNN